MRRSIPSEVIWMRWFGFLMISAFLVPNGSALAAERDVCVRKFNDTNGVSPCRSSSVNLFKEVVTLADPTVRVCIRAQNDLFCKNSPDEYDHVVGIDGSVICTANFDNDVAGNFCAAQPDAYVYVKPAY